jgi:hypothetical protein
MFFASPPSWLTLFRSNLDRTRPFSPLKAPVTPKSDALLGVPSCLAGLHPAGLLHPSPDFALTNRRTYSKRIFTSTTPSTDM